MADGNQLVKAPISAGGQVAAIVPQSFDDAYRIANALAISGITPFKKPEECLAVIMAGAEVGLTPFAATQSFAVINGRVSIWGDGMMAVVRAQGVRVHERLDGQDASMIATCSVTRPDDPEPTVRTFSAADAKRAGLWDKQGPWKQYPQRMLQMRARAWAIRDCCADLLRGIKMAEEMQDVEVVESHVIDRSGDHDQRPADERESGVMIGKPARDLFDDLAQRMSDSADGAELEEIWSEAEQANVSRAKYDALAEHYEAVKLAHEEGLPIPQAARFTEAPEPSPFAALDAQALAVKDEAGLAALNAALKDGLPKCSADERAKLKVMHLAAKQRVEQSKSGAAASRTDEGAGDPNAQPGGSAPPASSSPFEALKEECLAILRIEGVKRRRAKFTEFTAKLTDEVMAQMTAEQRVELDKVNDNVGKEIGA